MTSSVSPFVRNENTTDVWLTPRNIVESLGSFDMDPCSPIEAPWRLAPLFYTEEHDGLSNPWIGRVFMNPPYGRETVKWMDKLSKHGNGIALVFARVDVKWFQKYVWQQADMVFFFNNRLKFYTNDGALAGSGASAPSCLVAYGEQNVKSVLNSKLNGFAIDLNVQRRCNVQSK
jgi:DNA N-6-adenine-methyltransferase (Dam)